jgi:cobyrinic acid a,c-diamide synthase
MSALLIGATRKSSGKTSFSLGLASALHARGHRVQTFKKGPDYIDPMWLSRASHRPCFNLDFHNMTPPEIRALFQRQCCGAEVVLVEGNKGLHDGMAVDGSDSSAGLAALLGLPVILLVDASGITRGIAPLLRGYREFEPRVDIAGVVLNKVAGSRHEHKLRNAIEHYCDVPVLGAIGRGAHMEIEERHIGLVPSSEDLYAKKRIEAIGRTVADSVDIDALLEATRSAPFPRQPEDAPSVARTRPRVRIGVARDRAFCFYYPDDIETMRRLGVEVVCFDALRHDALPDVDALFIGGGFPELHLDALADNSGMRADIKRFVEDGRPVYAECGGLMYLCRHITYSGATRPMVGALPANAVMQPRPVGRGYVVLRETDRHPWPPLDGGKGGELPVHEFHYSRLVDLGGDAAFAYDVLRGAGIREGKDGLIHRNTLAVYSHHRNVGTNRWVERFVRHIESGARDRTAPREEGEKHGAGGH